MNKLNICYFDNEMGEFDKFNPRFVMEQKYSKDIVDLLSNKHPYHFTKEMIKNRLNCVNNKEFNQAVKHLKDISAIVEKDNRYSLNFTFFTSRDIKNVGKIIKEELNKNKKLFADKINSIKPKVRKLYPNINEDISLYHLLCGKIFDGEFFDYLGNDGFLKMSYKKNGNRDYMIIGYHNNSACNKFNNSLFCSFNNARYEQSSLTSFGTPNERFDYFRYFKLREANKLHGKFFILHRLLKQYNKETIIKNSIEILNKISHNQYIQENNFLKALKITNYVSADNQIIVPVFDNYIKNVKKLNNIVINELGEHIKLCLKNIKQKVVETNILCLAHGAPIDEVCNELWHIFFGYLNNYLIKQRIVAKPKSFLRQGQYLKCIYLKDCK